jgi:hypothetical protein
MTLETC